MAKKKITIVDPELDWAKGRIFRSYKAVAGCLCVGEEVTVRTDLTLSYPEDSQFAGGTFEACEGYRQVGRNENGWWYQRFPAHEY